MGKQGIKGNKHKYAGRNNGPARQRYWASATLERHKVQAIMEDTGVSRAVATDRWRVARAGRRMKFSGTSSLLASLRG